ncbi:MAG: hypothetical protein R2939_10815 [Kofleriaceae bacterium]
MRADTAAPGDPTIDLTPDGRLRMVRPSYCAADVVVDLEDIEIRTIRPNLATFVVGVVAGALGVVATASAASGDEPASDPTLYGGVALLGGGAALAIGPWLGLSEHRRASPPQRRVTGSEATRCGETALPGPAVIGVGPWLRGFGELDELGAMTQPVFTWIDAFELTRAGTLVAAEQASETPTWSARLALGAEPLLAACDAFFAAAGIDATDAADRPRRPRGARRARRHPVGARRRCRRRAVLPLTNDGAGDASGSCARGSAPGGPSSTAGCSTSGACRGEPATLRAELSIALSPEADAALSGEALDLNVLLRDAHHTVSEHPIRFRGMLLSELPSLDP